jgi:signal transduction histidine kinase
MARTAVSRPSFFSGGGVAGALLRSIDWADTDVGPIAQWSESLKTTVGTILHSRHPMFLWWGPHLVQFYNDAYLPSFGQGKHPVAMGQRGASCWHEIWPVISPQIDDVMARAMSSWHDDQLVPIFRNGRLEDVYWTYGYSPVFEASGAVGGTLVVCTETTPRVISDRRLRTLQLLATQLAEAVVPSTVISACAEVVGRAEADVPFALFYRVTADAGAPCLLRAVGLDDDATLLVEASVAQQLDQLSSASVVQRLSRPIEPIGYPSPEPVDEVFIARIATRDPLVAAGYVVFGLNPRLPFDDAYRDYLRQLTGCIAQTMARNEAVHVRVLLENERNNLLEQAPVATAVLIGPEHVFLVANPLYRKMIGRDDLVGRRYCDAFPELGDTIVTVLDRVYRTGEPFVTHEMAVRLDRDGTGRLEDCFFMFNLEPMRNAAGEVYGMMAVAVEITATVVARQVLEKAEAEREALLRELEQASRTKDEFLARLGHELRNPLSSIVMALHLMRQRGVTGGDKERAVIDRQVAHLTRLVEDLVDVSRIARGAIPLRVERLVLSDVIARAIEMVSPLIAERQHHLTVDVRSDLLVDADAGRLCQVIVNVLANAAKYTDRNGDIAIRGRQRAGAVGLAVRDNGVGIDPSMLRHVLEPFAQEHQGSDRSRGGLGLGLAIVSSLVAAHGGTVSLHSDGRGRGTECVIWLPAIAGEILPSEWLSLNEGS